MRKSTEKEKKKEIQQNKKTGFNIEGETDYKPGRNKPLPMKSIHSQRYSLYHRIIFIVIVIDQYWQYIIAYLVAVNKERKLFILLSNRKKNVTRESL